MKYDNLKLENQICHRLYTASNIMTRVYRPMLKKLDITYPQYVVLMALWEEDVITVQRLIELTSIDGGTLSLMLTKLATKSFITVAKDEDDRRKKIISLTTKGRKLKDKALSIPKDMWSCLESLEYDDALTLISLLDKMNCDLKKFD